MVLSASSLPLRLARTLLSRPFTWQAVEEALVDARGGPDPGLTRLVTVLLLRLRALRTRARSRAALHELVDYLDNSRRVERLFGEVGPELAELPPPTMLPLPGAPKRWQVPAITTVAQLADWLRVQPDELLALACRWRQDREHRDDRLQHYHRRWLPRRGGPPRLLEAPKARLKAVQRRILTGILNAAPPHRAAHGFVRGRGVGTFAAAHVGAACVLRLDVADFFASVRGARVRGVFLAMGYPIDVAELLACLCTTRTPDRVCHRGLHDFGTVGAVLATRLRARHLPQGAPTSPALANLVAFHLDARLTGLARRFGARYSRYADDLLFSGVGAFVRGANRLAVYVAAVLLQEGFAAAHRKTRRMPQGVAQHAAGLVLNVHGAVPRRERERLEAVLVNCVRHGPASQNRVGRVDFEAHLRGRIAHVEHHHAPHAARLWRWFDRIVWE